MNFRHLIAKVKTKLCSPLWSHLLTLFNLLSHCSCFNCSQSSPVKVPSWLKLCLALDFPCIHMEGQRCPIPDGVFFVCFDIFFVCFDHFLDWTPLKCPSDKHITIICMNIWDDDVDFSGTSIFPLPWTLPDLELYLFIPLCNKFATCLYNCFGPTVILSRWTADGFSCSMNWTQSDLKLAMSRIQGSESCFMPKTLFVQNKITNRKHA